MRLWHSGSKQWTTRENNIQDKEAACKSRRRATLREITALFIAAINSVITRERILTGFKFIFILLRKKTHRLTDVNSGLSFVQ